jgi:hypothetical protein
MVGRKAPGHSNRLTGMSLPRIEFPDPIPASSFCHSPYPPAATLRVDLGVRVYCQYTVRTYCELPKLRFGSIRPNERMHCFIRFPIIQRVR